MSSSPACLDGNAIDWENSQIYTYCGNCKGIRELIDKHNELKRRYQSALKLNELLVQKIAALERRPAHREEPYVMTPSWNEEEERAAFQRFMSNISCNNALPLGIADLFDQGKPRLRDIKIPSS